MVDEPHGLIVIGFSSKGKQALQACWWAGIIGCMSKKATKYSPDSIEGKWPQSAKASRGKQNQGYNPSAIESKWQKVWEKTGVYTSNLDKAKKPFYNLMMFPYPSAEGLHVGSVFTFTGVDTFGRFKRMQGFDVFEPMGLDGFGIHSENYALKVGRHPKEQAKISEENFYRQLRLIGNSFDWSRKLETYDPAYYKWTQWIFIQLFKRGLAYRKKAPVNFCPKDLTVLADEQVIDGKCERCSSVVEKRDLEQWFFRITKYADRLLNNIPKLNWTEKVKIAQREWIGRREGTTIKFPISNEIEVFTTRGDTLYGATFLVLAPEHTLVGVILNSFQDLKIPKQVRNDIEKYVLATKKKTDQERTAEGKDKTGVFSGLYAINPLNQEKLPVWIADYALMEFGTGALFGDAHDERDVVFAKKYGIPLKVTLITGDKERDARILSFKECFTGDGILIESGEFSGLSSKEAREKVAQWLTERGQGGKTITYHLRDWLISRQRYWGPPIPMIYCKKCDWQPVAEEQLPVLLPDVKDWKPKGIGEGPLASVPAFVNTKCPKCNGKARRETDVSDTFLDSSWYFFRYLSTEFNDKAFDLERAKKWLPVTMYIGGAEHSVLHLLYSRFITMVFKDLGLIDFEEPYAKFYAHGLIIKEGKKMSKSKGNVINPDEYLAKYGADCLRAYLRFVGPFDMGGDFRDSGIESMHRFLTRIWTFVATKKFVDKTPIDLYLEKMIQEITVELEHLRFNTAFARLMMYYNFLVKKDKSEGNVYKDEVMIFIKLLAPFVPFLAEELWEFMNQKYSVHTQRWPKEDKSRIEKEYGVTIAIQINGKTRGTIDGNRGMTKEEVWKKAQSFENVQKYLKGGKIKKVIYVLNRIINFVM